MYVRAFSWPALLLLGALLPWAQPASQTSPSARIAVNVQKLGPQVGQRVPDFKLADQHGKTWTLQSLMGREGAMLVFFRSADW
jgi:hypothetical protein